VAGFFRFGELGSSLLRQVSAVAVGLAATLAAWLVFLPAVARVFSGSHTLAALFALTDDAALALGLVYFFPLGPKRKPRAFPWGTFLLVTANCLVFALTLNDEGLVNLLLLRWNVLAPVTWLTAMFLHADSGHLYGNLSFFVMVGYFVEDRIGTRTFLKIYFLAGLGSALAWLLLQGMHRPLVGCLGASGAISGIGALYLVRCYYARIKCLPMLYVYPLSRLPSASPVLLLGVYQLRDVLGGLVNVFDPAAAVGHTAFWGHLGGSAVGFYFARRMGMFAQARDEATLEEAARTLRTVHRPDAVVGGLRELLARQPRNAEAMGLLARLLQDFKSSQAEAGALYRQAVALSLAADAPGAVALARHYWRGLMGVFDGPTQLAVARAAAADDPAFAEQGLRHWIETSRAAGPTAHLPEALLLQAQLLERRLALPDAAADVYRELARDFAAEPAGQQAAARLARLAGKPAAVAPRG
jgi:membrane associated rhomboid family serine protease